MPVYDTYRDAHTDAQAKANASGREVGIRRVREYGKDRYVVAHLPAASHRYGDDLRAEVVAPCA